MPNVEYSRYAHLEFVGPVLGALVRAANSVYLFGSELCHRIVLASRLVRPALAYAVGRVPGIIVQKEMRHVHALRVIAGVTHEKCGVVACSKEPSVAVRSPTPTAASQRPILVDPAARVASPLMTVA